MAASDLLNTKTVLEAAGWTAPVIVLLAGASTSNVGVIQLGGLLLILRAGYYYFQMKE